MWVAKIRFASEKLFIGSKAVAAGIDFFAFPLSYSYEADAVLVHVAGTLVGSPEGKKGFVTLLRREKRVKSCEVHNDFLIMTFKEPLFAKDIYHKDIIHLSPALVSSKGFELITIGSFHNERIGNVCRLLKTNLDASLLSLNQKKVTSISVVKAAPELTEKQKAALHLAIKEGYFEVPRRIDVQSLAKLAGLSFSTYQVHLRKAEKKVIPNYFE